jgi:hypothetical protein
VVVLAGLFVLGIGLGQQHGFSFADMFKPAAKAPPGEFPVLDPSPPMRISIPAIDVAASVHAVGRAPDGTIATPSLNLKNEAGWYREGPSPGQYGPAIIVGHVDTKDKPAVFHRLRELVPGQRIEIVRRDRTVAVFEVGSVEQFGKQMLPAARVFQDFSRPGLRLITCGGNWIGGSTGYADNVIVFASLIETRNA